MIDQQRLCSGRWLAAAATALLLLPTTVHACAIDNTASLSISGVQAQRTASTSAPSVGGAWAPFTLPAAFAAGTVLQVSERQSDLARSLSPAQLATPYRWVFGDGTTASGHAVAHRYARPGTYRLAVYGYDPASQRWFQFDAALVRLVPAAQVTTANLGYYALRALDVVMSSLIWVVDALLILIVAVVLRRHSRKRRRVPQRALSARQERV